MVVLFFKILSGNVVDWASTVALWLVYACFGFSCLGSCPGWGHCVVSLRKTFDSHRASPHPGVQISTSELNVGGNPVVD